ncbi:hypothetical protein E2562_022191 [Oryza meyeriana var. granulata]|uniref:Uncharacterized protein n=1 Tax=Oryza meyeriana var. granulata TaxID=110450 RepID=A0A6G1DLU1_9ORYZ|nr:hypothetical protein E2562_022191 [Oryza meyeriana var. granulata]
MSGAAALQLHGLVAAPTPAQLGVVAGLREGPSGVAVAIELLPSSASWREVRSRPSTAASSWRETRSWPATGMECWGDGDGQSEGSWDGVVSDGDGVVGDGSRQIGAGLAP